MSELFMANQFYHFNGFIFYGISKSVRSVFDYVEHELSFGLF